MNQEERGNMIDTEEDGRKESIQKCIHDRKKKQKNLTGIKHVVKGQ
jgi:hypothetical protein